MIAPTRVAEPTAQPGRVAAFFSGGVDSWATVLANPDVTDLIFVRGIDLLPRLTHQEDLADEVEARLRGVADELGLPLHVVETNLRELSDPLARWETYYGCAVAAVAHFLAPAVRARADRRRLRPRDPDPVASGRTDQSTSSGAPSGWRSSTTAAASVASSGSQRSAATRSCSARCGSAGTTPTAPTTAGAATSA